MARRIFRAVCLQVSAGSDPEKNFSRILRLLEKTVSRKPDFIALPENFIWRGSSEKLGEIAAQAGDFTARFQILARRFHAAILLGSLLEPSDKPGKYYNTSILISNDGRVEARYRKIHLFQIGIHKVQVNEARHILRGKKPAIGKIEGVGVGLSICYDLRFPELYRKLSFLGAQILLVPSNFTYVTGEAHWETLLRARAIENQCFVIAPAQSGTNPESGIESFGTSLLIDPWGRVLARGKTSGEDVIWADLDLRSQSVLRKEFPVLSHRILGKTAG